MKKGLVIFCVFSILLLLLFFLTGFRRAQEKEKPSGPEIFTVDKILYQETPSAKGKIEVLGIESEYSGGNRLVWSDFTNVSNQVLEATAFIKWLDIDGRLIKTEKILEIPRFLPRVMVSSLESDMISLGEKVYLERYFSPGRKLGVYVRYPKNAIKGILWIETKTPNPISPAFSLKYYVNPPSAESLISIDWEAYLAEKGTPFEHWLIMGDIFCPGFKILNITQDKKISLVFKFEFFSASEILRRVERSVTIAPKGSFWQFLGLSSGEKEELSPEKRYKPTGAKLWIEITKIEKEKIQ